MSWRACWGRMRISDEMALRGVEQEVGLILLCSAVNSALRVISLSCSMRDTSIWVEMSWRGPPPSPSGELVMLAECGGR